MSAHIHHPGTQRDYRRQALRQGLHDQVVGLLMLVTALVLCLIPMVQQDGSKDGQVNEAVIGTIVLFAAASRLYRSSGMRSDLIVGAAGAYLLASTFFLGLQKTSIYPSNRVLDIVLGSALILLAAVGTLLQRAGHRHQADSQAGAGDPRGTSTQRGTSPTGGARQ
ncbi:hypothetical protein [Streptomyces sp. NPDC023588]|uniref:SPW repeat domain-containing protein n=1 Tax=Streptomyces sp. NPDC023588 TaxID=3154907 RepID=UPI0034026937